MFTEIGVVAAAAGKSTLWGRSLQGLQFLGDTLYGGFGDWYANTGTVVPFVWTAAGGLASTGHVASSECLWNGRQVGDELWFPHIDPFGDFAQVSIVDADGVWRVVTLPGGCFHTFDARLHPASGHIVVTGGGSRTTPEQGMAWVSTDGGVTFSDPTLFPNGTTSHLHWLGVDAGGDLVGYLGGVRHVYDGTGWSDAAAQPGDVADSLYDLWENVPVGADPYVGVGVDVYPLFVAGTEVGSTAAWYITGDDELVFLTPDGKACRLVDTTPTVEYVQVDLGLEDGEVPTSLAVSPDGEWLVGTNMSRLLYQAAVSFVGATVDIPPVVQVPKALEYDLGAAEASVGGVPDSPTHQEIPDERSFRGLSARLDYMDGKIVDAGEADNRRPAVITASGSYTSGVTSGNLNWGYPSGMSSADAPSWFEINDDNDPVFTEEGTYQGAFYLHADLAAAGNGGFIDVAFDTTVRRLLFVGQAGTDVTTATYPLTVWVGPPADVVIGGYRAKILAADPPGVVAYLVDNGLTVGVNAVTFAGGGAQTFTFHLVLSKVS